MIKKNSNKINKIIEVKNGKEDFWDSWFVFFLISALLYALYAEGVPYKVIGRFLSLPSLVIVAAFSGLSYAKSDNYQFNELGKVLKEDLILGGWAGTIIGLVIAFGGVDKSISNSFGNLFNAISACMIPLLYGYMIGNIIESCWPKKTV